MNEKIFNIPIADFKKMSNKKIKDNDYNDPITGKSALELCIEGGKAFSEKENGLISKILNSVEVKNL